MYINYDDSKEKFCHKLSKFLDSDDDGVFYIGHASILVRLNKKKFIFDAIQNTNFIIGLGYFSLVKLMTPESMT